VLADPDLVPCAVKFLQPVVATIISTLRAPKSSEGYKSIGGGSPLRRYELNLPNIHQSIANRKDAHTKAMQKEGGEPSLLLFSPELGI